jgi:hypothetical protein
MDNLRTFEEFIFKDDKKNIKEEIMSIFRKFKNIFPHLRPDTIERKVDKGEYLFEDGVVILYNIYTKRVKISDKINAYAGDVMLSDIANRFPGNGKTQEIFPKFIERMKKEGRKRILLTVRKENYLAINFYRKIGFKEVDKKSWAEGRIPGFVFEYNII